MVIKKEELLKALTEEQRAEAKALEKKIDLALRGDFVEGRNVIVHINGWPHERVRRHLEKLYREAGWKIKFNSEQRDGEWIELS